MPRNDITFNVGDRLSAGRLNEVVEGVERDTSDYEIQFGAEKLRRRQPEQPIQLMQLGLATEVKQAGYGTLAGDIVEFEIINYATDRNAIAAIPIIKRTGNFVKAYDVWGSGVFTDDVVKIFPVDSGLLKFVPEDLVFELAEFSRLGKTAPPAISQSSEWFPNTEHFIHIWQPDFLGDIDAQRSERTKLEATIDKGHYLKVCWTWLKQWNIDPIPPKTEVMVKYFKWPYFNWRLVGVDSICQNEQLFDTFHPGS
jgi:hypothetical protein